MVLKTQMTSGQRRRRETSWRKRRSCTLVVQRGLSETSARLSVLAAEAPVRQHIGGSPCLFRAFRAFVAPMSDPGSGSVLTSRTSAASLTKKMERRLRGSDIAAGSSHCCPTLS
jgi:hypothetical protein